LLGHGRGFPYVVAARVVARWGEAPGRPARADGKTESNRAHHGVVTETNRHSLYRCKPSYVEGVGSSYSIFGKGRRRTCLARGIQYKGGGRRRHG
jgi:hypothetical protein